MRIDRRIRLMMTTDAVGGVWIFSATLVRALASRGYDILLVSQGPRPNAHQRAMLADLPGVSLIETDLALEWQDPGGDDVEHASTVLAAIARDFDPDVIHLNGYREAAFHWAAPTVLVAHSCVATWSRGCGAKADFLKPKWTAYRDAVRRGLGRAGVWVAPTQAFRDAISDCYAPVPAGRVIRNGVVSRSSEFSRKQPVVLAVGRLWDKAKNLAAVAGLAQALEWPVRIAGPAQPDADGGSATPVGEGCRFLGTLSHDQVLGEMQRAAIFVSPALYEPFGLSVLEAAEAGCALVLSDIPTFRELWDDAALLVDPYDGAALRAALQSLCNDPAQRAALQDAARARAARYSLDRTTERYDALYRSQLAGAADAAAAMEVPA